MSWVDAKVVAAELGVPDTWVAAQARAGTIPHRRFGRYVRYDLEEVRDWARSLKDDNSNRRHRAT